MRLRHGWPLALLAALLVAIPILEVWLLVQVGQNLGLLPTVLILLVVAIVGFLLMRHEGSRAWKALNDAFTKGKVPTGELADAALILVGGVLLMLPGFLTDVIGLLFLLRWTRPFARKVIAFFVARRINRLGIPVMRARLDRENLIEGETVESPPGNGQKPEGPTIIAGEIEEPSQPARPEDLAPSVDLGAQRGRPLVLCAADRGTAAAPHEKAARARTWAARANRREPRKALGGPLRSRAPGQCSRAQLARTELAQPLGQQVLEFGDRAPFTKHVPMRTRWLLLFQLGPLAVGTQRLRTAPGALPHRGNVGLS